MNIWPFRRKPTPDDTPKPPEEDNRMSEDWRVGDLAVCLADNWMLASPFNPKAGDLLRVAAIDRAPGIYEPEKIIIGLGFEGKPVGAFWHNIRFRKAQTDREPATKSLSEMIRRQGVTPKQPQPVGA